MCVALFGDCFQGTRSSRPLPNEGDPRAEGFAREGPTSSLRTFALEACEDELAPWPEEEEYPLAEELNFCQDRSLPAALENPLAPVCPSFGAGGLQEVSGPAVASEAPSVPRGAVVPEQHSAAADPDVSRSHLV